MRDDLESRGSIEALVSQLSEQLRRSLSSHKQGFDPSGKGAILPLKQTNKIVYLMWGEKYFVKECATTSNQGGSIEALVSQLSEQLRRSLSSHKQGLAL